MTNLLIVESSAKSKTISKYLNKPDVVKKFGKFKVIASNGHVRDLVKKKPGTDAGIDVKSWRAHYEQIESKSLVIRSLAHEIQNAKTVWLAADMDREGEAIAWHIKDMFNLKIFKRITFNEITEDALIRAISNPRDIDYKLVDAQQGRRILDRIIGFKLTELLWKNFNSNTLMSAGRVQSVLLSLLCEIEEKFSNFRTEEYFTLSADFLLGRVAINEAKLYTKDGTIAHISKEESLVQFMKSLKRKTTVFNLNTKDTKVLKRNENPPPPFITSTIQQEAYNKLGWSSKKTMKVAQELYESGKITYMRTDSTHLSKEATEKIAKFIKTNFQTGFVERNAKKANVKNAQEAHEAIRPTKFMSADEIDSSTLNKDQKSLYSLVLKRAVCSQMPAASYEELHVVVTHSVDDTLFVGKTSVLVNPGYLEPHGMKPSCGLSKLWNSILQIKTNPLPLRCTGKSVWKSPPARLNEPRVIKLLEKEGLGRPSTYSSIVQKLLDRQFVEKKNVVGPEKTYVDYEFDMKNSTIKRSTTSKPFFQETMVLTPTVVGREVNRFLSKHFKKIIDTKFTSLMESDLDDIAKGKKKLSDVMGAFYGPFIAQHQKHSRLEKRDKKELVTEKKNFSIGGKSYVVRNARYGPVIQRDKSYISLKAYLLDTKKNLEDIDEKDVKFLSSLPRSVRKNITLNYGRYGFYLQHLTSKKSRRVYRNEIESVLNGDVGKKMLQYFDG